MINNKVTQVARCLVGYHETYTKAEDMNFQFKKEDLKAETQEDVQNKIIVLTTVRCRYCNYTDENNWEAINMRSRTK